MPERHYWDSTSWLDLFESLDNPQAPICMLWGAVTRGAVEALYSAVAMTEVLHREVGAPRPWTDPHDADALFDEPGTILVQIDRSIGERARSLRRAHALEAPDAIHLACAIEHNATHLITRDDDLLRLNGITRKDGVSLVIVRPADAIGGPLFQAPIENLSANT